MRLRARGSVAEVTTVQYFSGRFSRMRSTPASIARPPLSAISMRSSHASSSISFRSGRSWRTVSMARRPCAVWMATAGSMPRALRPCLPRALDRADGADQHAIHIEENATRMESDHVCRGCCVHIFRLAGRATRSRMHRGVQQEITEVAPGEIIRTGHCAMIRKRRSGCPALHGRAGWVCLSCN